MASPSQRSSPKVNRAILISVVAFIILALVILLSTPSGSSSSLSSQPSRAPPPTSFVASGKTGLDPNFVLSILPYFPDGQDRIDRGDHFIYADLFAPLFDKPVRILELSTAQNPCTACWKYLFPKAQLVSVLTTASASTFEAPSNTKTDMIFYGGPDAIQSLDILKNTISASFGPTEQAGFDIIIDNANHVPWQQVTAFAVLYRRALKRGGFYLIQGIQTSYADSYVVDDLHVSSAHAYKRFPSGVTQSPPGNVIELFKRFIDTVNRYYLCEPDYHTFYKLDSHVLKVSFFPDAVAVVKKSTIRRHFEYEQLGWNYVHTKRCGHYGSTRMLQKVQLDRKLPAHDQFLAEIDNDDFLRVNSETEYYHDEKEILNMYNIFSRMGSDKANLHGYHYFYIDLFRKLRDKPIRLLEIGAFKGSSLKAWKEIFPNASFIAGVAYGGRDTIQAKEFKYNYNGTYVYTGDQSDAEFLKRLLEDAGAPFDIIIDDGSHLPWHQTYTLAVLFKAGLKDGGAYVVEDLETNYWDASPEDHLYGQSFKFRTGLGEPFPGSHIELTKSFIDVMNRKYFCDDSSITGLFGVDQDIMEIMYERNVLAFIKKTQERRRHDTKQGTTASCPSASVEHFRSTLVHPSVLPRYEELKEYQLSMGL